MIRPSLPRFRRASLPVLALAASLLAASRAPAAPVAPHASWDSASLSNGFAAAVFDLPTSRLAGLFPHPYREARAGELTPDLLWDAYFGVARGGAGQWLPGVAPVTVAYENGTGILAVTRETGGLRLTERWFAPMGLEQPAVVAHLTVRNLGTAEVAGARVAFLQNFHVGTGAPEAGSDDERVDWRPDPAFVETCATSGRAAAAVPFPDPAAHAASPANPYATWTATGAIGTGDGGTVQDDAISAFAWDLPALAPGAEATVAVVLLVTDAVDPMWLVSAARGYAATRPDLLAAERDGWRAFHQKDTLPDTVTGDALALARQSLALLAMSQVREANVPPAFTPHGQILASLPPGQWNRTWVRDQAYAIAALSAAGHADLAADAAAFVLNGRANLYRTEVGADYAVSVCRYYGDGTEESDGDPAADGPNIEFDGFGLFLWALLEAGTRGGAGDELLQARWGGVATGVADVLAGLVGPDGLVRADSSIWERHWNGNEKRFAYTDATAVLGLCAAVEAGRLSRYPVPAAKPAAWRDAARRIAAATAEHLVHDGVLAQSYEEIATGRYLDASVVEAFNWDVLPPGGAVAQATLDALRAGLAVPTGHGLRRNDDGDWYDRQEWVFIDLRTATALRRAGRTAEAQALADWVLAQSRANLDLVAELYTEDAADYEGAVPMAGFGAASWLLWLLDPAPAVDVAACLAPDVPDTVPDAPPEALPDTPEATPDRPPEPAPDAVEPAPDTAADVPAADLGPRDLPPADAPDALVDPGAPDAPGDLPDPAPRRSSGCTAAGTPASLAPLLLLALAALPRRRR